MGNEHTPPHFGLLCLDGWHGRSEDRVLIVGETPKRYRIRAIEWTRLAGRRSIEVGQEALVPKRAVKIV